ncbi:hypothetical protein BLGI_3710 [Brevibacillus laterosporus GI-9]|nr:hypothetical protein BLGI_3710 [Brevibacillus laterosporus GI-9]
MLCENGTEIKDQKGLQTCKSMEAFLIFHLEKNDRANFWLSGKTTGVFTQKA